MTLVLIGLAAIAAFLLTWWLGDPWYTRLTTVAAMIICGLSNLLDVS